MIAVLPHGEAHRCAICTTPTSPRDLDWKGRCPGCAQHRVCPACAEHHAQADGPCPCGGPRPVDRCPELDATATAYTRALARYRDALRVAGATAETLALAVGTSAEVTAMGLAHAAQDSLDAAGAALALVASERRTALAHACARGDL